MSLDGAMAGVSGGIRIINGAMTVDVLVFSPDGDPLATVEISKAEGMRLVSLPMMVVHVFRATRESGGRVFVEPAGCINATGGGVRSLRRSCRYREG